MHVPYNGGGQSAAALISGQVSFMIVGLSVVLPLVKAGRLRPLAVTGPRTPDGKANTSRNAYKGGPPEFDITSHFFATLTA